MTGRALQIIESDDIYEEYHISEFDRKFLELYLSPMCNHNATMAMCLAMYGENIPDKDKRNTASIRAHRLLARIEIKKAIQDLRKVKFMEYKEKGLRLIEHWELSAYLDPSTLLDEDGNLLPMNQIPDEIRPLITDMKVAIGMDGITQIIDMKFQNKQKAQEMLAKAIGLLGGEQGEKSNNGDGDYSNLLAKIEEEDKENVG